MDSTAPESSPSTVAVHRCRFIDHTPSPITALAFPPFPLSLSSAASSSKQPSGKIKFGTLAVGRANGNIELCEWTGSDRQAQAPQAWVVRKTLTGPCPSKVDALAFTIRYPSDVKGVPTCADLRLFSSGGGSELVEWDLTRGCIRRTISSQAGAIWSLAPNPASTLLALGCEDGSVRLLSLANDTLEHHRRFDRVKCRVLSIAWGPPVRRSSPPKTASPASDDSSDSDEDEDEWTDAWLVTGGSDSALRKWDVATGRVLDRMGTDRMKGERTLVWAVGVLGDGTIVSGDSMGAVKFWDAQTCTQMQSFTAHGADVLCLAISPEGKTIYTSGVDQKIVQFSHVKTTNITTASTIVHAANSGKWVQSCARRMHSHDIRALAIWPPYTPLPASSTKSSHHPWRADIAPVLASGGLDMSVVLTPAATAAALALGHKVTNPLATSVVPAFEDAYHRRVAYPLGAGGVGVVRVARAGRLMCAARDTGVGVWRVLPRRTEGEDVDVSGMEEESGGWEKVLDVELNAHTNLIAHTISDDGRWLAVSDFYEARLFSLDVDEMGSVKPRRIRTLTRALQGALPPGASTGGATFGFTPDSGKMVMGSAIGGYVLLVDLGEEEPRVLRRWDHHRSTGGARAMKGPRGDGLTGEEMDVDDENIGVGEQNSAEACVSRLAISADGQWLATTDTLARTHIFNLDSVQHHAALPSFALPVQALAFEPATSNLLMLALPDNTFQVFDVEAGVFPEWARTMSTGLPNRFTRVHDPVLGIAFEPAPPAGGKGEGKVLFWGSTWMCRVNLAEHMSKGSKKRRRNSMKNPAPEEEGGSDFKMVTHYRPILHAEFLAPSELVVVERPLVDVLTTLPPAYFKPKYGAS